MQKLSICYILRLGQEGLNPPHNAEEQYQTTIKQLLSLLYSNPRICLTISISGIMLAWYEKHHPEVLQILSELTNRKQVEIIGGGYYEPLFPFLMPMDRVGQIEKLTTELRRTIGKRPRGIRLPQNAWEPQLLSSLKTCSFDYMFLDSELIKNPVQDKTNNLLPYIIEDSGKTLVVLPITKTELPSVSLNLSDYLQKLKKLVVENTNAIFCAEFDMPVLKELVSTNWLSVFSDTLLFEENIELTTPQLYFKTNFNYKKTFIPSGCKLSVPIKNVNSTKDLILTSHETQALYSRSLFANILINQYKGDKIRKKAAKEELWKAQHYSAFTDFSINGVIARQKAYNSILVAETQLKDSKPKEDNSNSLSFDFDFDGQKEYIFYSKNYTGFVSAIGGALFELDLNSICQNYVGEQRQMFTDYLFTKSEFENEYIKGKPVTSNVFQNMRYSEIKFSKSKKEVLFCVESAFGKDKQPVQLKKSYLFLESGVQVQYILKNKSANPLSCIFLVEFNVALNPLKIESQKVEVITEDSKESANIDQLYIHQNNVSLVQYCDTQAKNDLIFESNEYASLCLQPIFVDKTCISNCGAFYWKVEIPAGFEIEKTLTLNIKTTGKKSLGKSTKQS